MNKFLAANFLRNFLAIFLAFCAFYVFIDILINYKKLSFNTNLFIVYLLVTFVLAAYFLLPACIILALLTTKAALVSKNEFLALRAMGLSPLKIAAPQLLCALAICGVFSALSFSKLPYAAEYKDSILRNKSLASKRHNVLLATPSAMIYAKDVGTTGGAKRSAAAAEGTTGVAEIGDSAASLRGLAIIISQQARLQKLIFAHSARSLGGGNWRLFRAQILEFAPTSGAEIRDFAAASGEVSAANDEAAKSSDNFLANSSGTKSAAKTEEFDINLLPEQLQKDAQKLILQSKKHANFTAIKSQKKQTLDIFLGLENSAFTRLANENFNLKDAINLLNNLEDSAPMRAAIYQYSVLLFFAPFLGVALCRILPTQTRFSELSVRLISAIFAGLIIFGCLNLLQRFSQNGAISPEAGMLAPCILIIIISIHQIYLQNSD